MGTKIFNGLLLELKSVENFNVFKRKLKNYLLCSAFYSSVFQLNVGLMTSLLIVFWFAIFNIVFTCFIFFFWSYVSLIGMYLITVVILS
jgi:ABC-type multidrug transport system permease subunit